MQRLGDAALTLFYKGRKAAAKWTPSVQSTGGVPPPLGSNPPWSLAGECDFSSMKGAQEHEEEQLYSPALQPNSKKCQKTFDHTQHMVKKHWQRQDDGTR